MEGNHDRVPIAEERLSVEKVRVPGETVTVRTVVREETASLEETLGDEEIEVRRVPVDRSVSEAPSARTEGDTVIVPVVREELVVEKRLRIVEEVHITRRKTERQVSRQVPIRRTEVVIERHSPGETGGGQHEER